MMMAEMVVAYWMPHNDGIEAGLLDEPGQSSDLDLVDLYEVDGQVRTFAARGDAEEWLKGKHTRASDGWQEIHCKGWSPAE